MAKPTQNFEDAQFLDIISSARIAGLTALIHRLTLHLVSEKFELSDFLQGVANVLHEQDFVEAVGYMESCVSAVQEAESLKKELDS